MGELMGYTERMLRACIAEIPDGRYAAEDVMDDDGLGTGPVPIRVVVTVRGDRAIVDFSKSADQVRGGINANRAVTLSAALYVFRCLLPVEVPANDGLLRPIELVTREGTIVDAKEPAAVAGGNVETSQRIVDVLLQALACALPDRIPASSSGTMANFTVGGADASGEPFSYYETIAGGAGAGPGADGRSGVQTHMTNTRNTPIEAFEHAYPLLVTAYRLRDGSGGDGLSRGGDGVIREFRALVPCHSSILADRMKTFPRCLAGGAHGAAARIRLRRAGPPQAGRWIDLPSKTDIDLEPGDTLRIETPGGAGHGAWPDNRDIRDTSTGH